MQRNIKLTSKDEAYEIAKRAALERLERGTPLGGGPLSSRDELYGRLGPQSPASRDSSHSSGDSRRRR